MTDDIEDLGWGFLRRMREPREFWEPPEEQLGLSRPTPRKAGLTALAVTLGLAVGAFALYQWKRDKVATAQEADAPAAEPHEYVETTPVFGRRPLMEPMSLPRDQADFEQLLQTARAMVALTRKPDQQLALTWAWTWSETPYPETSHPEDHPSVGEAKALVAAAVEAARAERATQAQPGETGAATSRPAEAQATAVEANVELGLEAESIEEFTCEVPRPGYFFRVRAGDTLLGDAGIATGALLVEAMAIGFDEGWERELIEERAAKLAAKAHARAAYAELIRKSSWNAGRVERLTERTLLWLPPLEQLRLGERNRRIRIPLDARPWPDGSSRLEPPPQLRGAHGESLFS
jgi:hypothetical protein